MQTSSAETMVAGIMDNVRRVFQVVNEQSKRVERETGLTGPQVWAIKVISNQVSVRVSDLARKMYLHPATVGGIIDRLEKRGLAVRTRSEVDRRVVEVTLTDEGRKLVNASPDVVSNTITHGLESLAPEELEVIHRGLEKLATILNARDLPPHLIGAPEVNLPEEV